MLDPTWRDSGGIQSLLMVTSPSQNTEDFIMPDPRSSVQRRNTVKEMLMLRRQKWKRSKEDNIPEHKFKSAKSEAFPNDSSLQLLTAPLAVNPNIPAYVLNAAPGNSLFPSQQLQHPSVLQEQIAPTAEAKTTLFHWQIQQEAMKMEGVSLEQLTTQDADGDTFLHIAVAQGRRALAYVLAAKMGLSGSLDIKEHNGQTALQIAVATNQHLIVADLLACGANVNTQDLWGRSPLHVCVEKGYFLCLQSIGRTLTDTGQPLVVDMFNYDGLTPLHRAVLSHNAVVKDLQSLDKSVTCMATERQVKRRRMYLECIKFLLHMGASCETKERKSGRTCLHMAAEEANMELLHLFLEQPSSLSFVKHKTFSGNTALHIVSSLQNHKAQVEAVRLLMRKGSDPGSRNCENELPSQLVPEGPTGDKERKSGRTCLHMAAEEANMELLHLFLEQPSSLSFVKHKTFSGNTALHIVSSLQNHKAQVEAVRLLMRKGSDPGSRNCENELPSQLVPEGPTGDKVRRILKGKYVHV